jgi:predicted nucleic acid-binding protein
VIWIGLWPLFAPTSARSPLVELSAEVTQAALALLTRHPLGTGDSVQLASCLHLRHQIADDVRLLAYDARLNDAARVEGVTLMVSN